MDSANDIEPSPIPDEGAPLDDPTLDQGADTMLDQGATITAYFTTPDPETSPTDAPIHSPDDTPPTSLHDSHQPSTAPTAAT